MNTTLLKKIGKWLAMAAIVISALTGLYYAFVTDEGKVKVTTDTVKKADSIIKKTDSLFKDLKDTAK